MRSIDCSGGQKVGDGNPFWRRASCHCDGPGTRGLGAAISRSLVEAGNQVIALYRSDRTRAAQLESELGASAAVLTRDVDVADPDLARAFVGEVLEQPRGASTYS